MNKALVEVVGSGEAFDGEYTADRKFYGRADMAPGFYVVRWKGPGNKPPLLRSDKTLNPDVAWDGPYNNLGEARIALADPGGAEAEPAPSSAPAPSSRAPTAGRFRKKPVVVEAFQMTLERRWDNSEWPGWLNKAWQEEPGTGAVWIDPDAPIAPDRKSAAELICGTLEGPLHIAWADWIIRGIDGELYPCKPDKFAATYEPVMPTAEERPAPREGV